MAVISSEEFNVVAAANGWIPVLLFDRTASGIYKTIYQTGLNTSTELIYNFTRLGSRCCGSPSDQLYRVILPKEARVIIETDAIFSTDKLLLQEMFLNDAQFFKFHNETNLYIRFVEKETEELCLAAIKKQPESLRYIKNQTENMCVAGVRENGEFLFFISNQTEIICLEAVKQNGLALLLVHKKTLKICKEAVKQNKDALRYVPSELKVNVLNCSFS